MEIVIIVFFRITMKKVPTKSIFYSFDPNPSKMIQFEGRTTRSFDIKGKTVYVLCSLGQEKKALEEIVKQRARATADMTNTDISVIMDILLERETT